MKKTISLLTVTLLVISMLTVFCACGENNNGNIDENGVLTDDTKDIIDDGDLDKNDGMTNSSTSSDNGTNSNTDTNSTGNMTDDATK